MAYPQVFEHKKSERIATGIAYVLGTALIVCLGGLCCLAGVGSVLVHVGCPRWVAQIAGVVTVLALASAAIWAVYRDFRFHYLGQVVVDEDKIALPTRRGQVEILYSDIDAITLWKEREALCLTVCRQDGKRFHLPRRVASLEQIGDAIKLTVVPVITEKWIRELESGEQVVIDENRWTALWRFCQGWMLFPLSILVMLTIKGIPTGLRMYLDAKEGIFTGWRGMVGRLTLNADGVQRGQEFLPWTGLVDVDVDVFGGYITTSAGRTMKISPYADNYLTLIRFLSTVCEDQQRHEPQTSA